jgi:hypothetical protein
MSDTHSAIGLGAAAGLAGTLVMMAMRSFDQKYAPGTVSKLKEDPGAFLVHQVERASGRLPHRIEASGAMATHAAYGTTLGVLYGWWRGRGENRSALVDGVAFGSAVYLLGHSLELPLAGLEKPIWKQDFPEIAGGLLRHVAYGVAVASTYGAADAVL